MYKIATLNKISPVGLNRFSAGYEITDKTEEANGIMVRSQAMHDMEFSENLLAIARAGAGVNNIPLDRCAESGIVVFNTPGANANAVKELVIAGMLLAARNLPEALVWAKTLVDSEDSLKAIEKGKGQFAGNELCGKTLGVVGLGAIGVLIANSAAELGMSVIGYDPYLSVRSAHALSPSIPVVSNLDDLLPKCDYITVHVPALTNTKGMFNADAFAKMQDGAVLLNFARDTLVNDDALLAALESGKVRRYVTDFPDNKIIGAAHVIAVPHLGASTEEAEDNCAMMAADELIDYIENGNITNSVNFPVCTLGTLKHEIKDRVCMLNKNTPNLVSKITAILADMGLPITDMVNKTKGDYAATLIDLDADANMDELLEKLGAIDGTVKLRILK